MSQLEDLPKPLLPASVYGYTLVASFSSFVYGYNTGIIAPAILFIPHTFPLTTTEISTIVSIILIGAIFGSIFSGRIADAVGRRKTLAWNNMLMLIAAVVAALGNGSRLMMLSRFVLGLGVGVASVIPALYITEVAPSHVRGKLGAINQLCGWTGIAVSYFVGYEVVACTAGDLCWRSMFASGAVLCIFHWILVIAVLPETPQWLVNNGQCEEARLVLTRIYGDSHETHIIQQYQVLCDRRDYHEPVCLSEAEIVASKHQRPLLIAILMQIFQQASGNSVIVYYCTIMLHSMGRSSRDALLYNALACIPQLLVLVLVVFTLDKNGRRPALLISEVGIAVGLVIIGSATVIKEINQRFWILLVGIVIHRAFFAAGMGPVPGVLVAETLPFPIRGRALSLSLAINWLCNYIVTASFPLLATWTHPSYVYWTFALIAFLGFLFISVVVEETKGVSLEKIEQRTSPEVPELQFTKDNSSLDESRLPRPCSPPSDLR